MDIIKGLIADLNAILQRIETTVGMHPHQATAAAGVKEAVTALAQHPQASVAPSGVVSPGMEAPAESDAQVTTETPANSAPIDGAGGAGTAETPPVVAAS